MARDIKRDDRLRILIANSALYIGGAENVTATLCRGLDRNAFDVCVAHFKGHGPIAKELEAEGFDVVRVPAREEGDLLTSLKLRRIIVERGIDLVHTHDVHTLVDASLCSASVRRLRHVSTLHHGHYPRRDRRSHWLEAAFLRAPDHVVAVGEAQRRAIEATYRMSPGRIGLIHNGVADAMARARDDQRERVRRGADIVVGSISTLIEQKGLDVLLDAARLLVDRGLRFRMVVVGDGHLRKPLEQRLAELRLAVTVEFLGWIEDAASRVLPWIDVFVQSSRWEAMSMVVLEAMSCGCPVVATTVGENPYVIRDGASGFLVAPDSAPDLAEAIRRLIEDPGLRERFAKECRRDYEQRYTAARMCSDYAALYHQTCASAAPRIALRR